MKLLYKSAKRTFIRLTFNNLFLEQHFADILMHCLLFFGHLSYIICLDMHDFNIYYLKKSLKAVTS